MANESVQKAAKCIIGKDYPVAMIDHSQSIRVNRERMRIVFQQLSKYRPRKFEFSLTKLTSKPDVPSNATFFQLQLQICVVRESRRSISCWQRRNHRRKEINITAVHRPTRFSAMSTIRAITFVHSE